MEQTLPPPNPGEVSESERHWAAIAHMGALILALLTSWMAGVAGVIGAGVVYLIKRDDSPFVAAHAKEAINFNLSMLLYVVAAIIIGVVLLGVTVLTLGIGILLTAPAGLVLLLALAALAVMWLVCGILATIKAYQGEAYRYPLTIRLLQ